METLNVQVRRAAPDAFSAFNQFVMPGNLETDLQRAQALAKMLDTQFSLGGVQFGLEGILGLVPVVGDVLGGLLGLYPIWIAQRHRLGKGVQLRMAANLLLETVVGAVPVLGDMFDIAFKANVRNYRLLERAAGKLKR